MIGLALALSFFGAFAATTPPAPPPAPVTTVDAVIQSAIAAGNVAMCTNGSFSDNTDFGATCSSHDGVARWLAPFATCGDGTVIALSEDATCDDHDGFGQLLPADFRPYPGAADVAQCNNGTYSNNVEFDKTCSSNGGVAMWLAAQGSCRDGTVIEMSAGVSCKDQGGFANLILVDVAVCADGSLSSLVVFADTCRLAGGVAQWLAPSGECVDGTVIELSPTASCQFNGGFARLVPAGSEAATPTTATAPTTTALAALTTVPKPPVEPVAAVSTITPPAPAGPGVGDTDTSGDLSFTVHTFEDPVTEIDEYFEPESGNKYIAVEVTITNLSDETQSFSTLLFAEVIDSQNQRWDVSLFGLGDRPGLDVEIPPGEARRGWVVFEVPEASTGFRVRFKGSMTADGATFTLS